MRAGLLVLLVGLLAASGGCGESREPPPSELTGAIVAIDGEGSDIRSFTLASEGEEYEIFIAADVDYGFDLAHLHEHEETGDPVHCRLEEREDRLYALSIDDA